MISIARPLLSSEEEAAIQRVLASGQLAQGENVAAFERRFAQVCQVREARRWLSLQERLPSTWPC